MKRDEKKLYEAAFDQVGRQVFELLAPTPGMLSIEHKLLTKQLKKHSFTTTQPVVALTFGGAAHVAQGNFDRVIEAAMLLRAYPFTGNYDMWSGPNTVQYMAVRLLRVAGDDLTADELEPHLYKDLHGGEPGELMMTSAMEYTRSGKSLRRVWRGVPETHIFDRLQQLSWLYGAVATLSMMWVLNDEDVTEWSLAEIDEEIERNIAFIPVLDALKGDERPPYLGLSRAGCDGGSHSTEG